MSAETPMPEITELILAAGGAELLRCMQCGTCTGVCPWPPRRRFSPRQVLRLAALGLSGYEADGVWTCVGCASCNLRCPRGIDVIEVLRSVRALLHESGGGPKSFRAPLASLRSQGNPWMGEREERGPFAAGLGLPRFSNSAETLLFFCCTQVWDPRNRRVAEALVAVLRRAGQALATLEPELGCCGDQARRVGAVELDQLLRQANRQLLQRHGVRRAVVSSPHCLQALRLDAPGGVGEELLAVRHHTQLLQELLARGALAPALPVPVRAVFHDPCYLGRHAGEYEAPRAVLRAIPGLEL
ncbi:MAG: (Fe-S)-binding protein, partial [Deltaproteobacteria bacterium]|nr:(Fe-S)-binding protein [Deltaproteobacteria bacterium]